MNCITMYEGDTVHIIHLDNVARTSYVAKEQTILFVFVGGGLQAMPCDSKRWGEITSLLFKL